MSFLSSRALLAGMLRRAVGGRAYREWPVGLMAAKSMAALAGIFAAAVLSSTVAAAAAPNRKDELERRLAASDGTVMVVAHRACWKGTSENSIAAIRACIAGGIDMVELDVRATRDGKLVLMHDASVDRMTEGTGQVSDLDWAELRKLHLREGKGTKDGRPTPLTSRRIPTFEEALRAAKDRILVNIDAKVLPSPAMLAMVDAAGGRKQVLFKAEAPLQRILELAPWVDAVRFMPILREPDITADPTAAIAGYDPIHPIGYEIDVKDRAFGAVLTQPIGARCARYWVDSLAGRAFSDTDAITDPDDVWGRLTGLGVDAIQTDEPLMLRAYLRRKGVRSLRCSAR